MQDDPPATDGLEPHHPDLVAARAKWRYRGTARPPFAEATSADQRSVWDFPRPPAFISDPREVRVVWNGITLAYSHAAITVQETAGPPTWYVPPDAVDLSLLYASSGTSVCEWKGTALWFDVGRGSKRVSGGAWTYPRPFPGSEAIASHYAFYPHQLECSVAGERVVPQPGDIYGGWITSELTGPFKGAPGTEWW